MPPGLRPNFTPFLEFPSLCEDPQKFKEEFKILAETYESGPGDLYNLLHMLLGPGGAQRW